MEQPIITVKNLSFSYNGTPILQDVSFHVEKGEFLAMIGPNGGGKTSLLKLMLGLLDPDHGEVRIFGEPPKKAAPRIGYVPQDIHINKTFPISALDVVLMGRLTAGWGWARHSVKDRNAALLALEKLEMEDFSTRRIGELSGGQLQRIFIARALVSDPELLFLDEPTASIDTKGQAEFYGLLKRLNERVTIVMVSHDVMILSGYVKSVACVNRNVHYHDDSEITEEMLDAAQCPVQLIAHGIPHRVLHSHGDE